MKIEEVQEANLKIPQAIQYLVETSKQLLEYIEELEYERDEYKRKFLNEAQLRASSNILTNGKE